MEPNEDTLTKIKEGFINQLVLKAQSTTPLSAAELRIMHDFLVASGVDFDDHGGYGEDEVDLGNLPFQPAGDDDGGTDSEAT